MADGLMLYGKRGSGKGLAATSLIADRIRKGCRIATNLNLHLEHLTPPTRKAVVIRVPDHPSVDDLVGMGSGNPGITLDDQGEPVMSADFDDDKNGLLVLDEVSDYLNARDWQKKGRADVLSWLNHSRKYGWDLIFIGQGPNQLDKQVRENLIDRFGHLRRLDKVLMPVIGSIGSWFGFKITLPRMHVLVVRVGNQPGALISERKVFNNKHLYKAYDTLQVFSADTGVRQGEGFCYLSHWHLKGRYMHPLKLYFPRLFLGFLASVCISGFIGYSLQPRSVENVSVLEIQPAKTFSDARIVGYWRYRDTYSVVLSDGVTFVADEFLREAGGVVARRGENWFKEVK